MLDPVSLEQRLKDIEGENTRLRSTIKLLDHQLAGAELLINRYRNHAQEDTIGAPWAILVGVAGVITAAGIFAWRVFC